MAKASALTDSAAAKKLYITKRDQFRNDPRTMAELTLWKKRDDKCDYPILNRYGALISEGMLKKMWGEQHYRKSDAIFSDYKIHFKELILSESEHFYIILNKESYDQRQYPQWFDTKYNPGENTPEGQAFAHTIVIPKGRIFNVVDPDATVQGGIMLEDMKDHFCHFWKYGAGPKKILLGLEKVITDRNAALAKKRETTELAKKVALETMTTFRAMSEEYQKLEPNDFVYAFHPFPDCSVGHLHMHVFPVKDKFRTFSAKRHDWKTIPLNVIVEAEREHSS